MKTRFTTELNDALSRFIATASEAEMDIAFENAGFNVYRNCVGPFEGLFGDVFNDIAASSMFRVSLVPIQPSKITALIVSERDVNRAADYENLALAA